LNRDQVHFGTTGSAIYVSALQQAVDLLSVLPTRRPPKSAPRLIRRRPVSMRTNAGSARN
jgi:hypothetical protein